MGVTIRFPKSDLDCGYTGFKILRERLLNLVPHERLKEIYDDVQDHCFCFNASEKKKFFDEIDKKINDIDFLANKGSSQSEKNYLARFNFFFWSCDCGAKMRPSIATAIWHYIKDAEIDFQFGYSGRSDCATFQQFKQGIKDCVESKKGFEWF